MALFTVIDEGYEVSVCRTVAALLKAVAHDGFVLEADTESDAKPATEKEIKAALKKGDIRLYEPGARDWKIKVQSH